MDQWPALQCPEDGQPLTQTPDALNCDNGHSYSIVSQIPRFVGGRTYADHFGAQWNRYRTTQLDSYTGKPITADRIRRCVGEDLWDSLAGRTVLECGCGAGRFTEVLLGRGARVYSIDLSSAVEANAANFAIGDSHRIAQADILRLPFAPRQFDVVFCLGVIQHTPSPERTIEALFRQLKPGGTLVIDHYTYDLGWCTRPAPLARQILKRLPEASAMNATERLVRMFLPLYKAVLPSRTARILLHHVSPITCYYTSYPELDDRLQYEWALLDTHDTLTDWYKHRRSRRQIQRTLERLGLEDVWCEYGGNGVEARGRRAVAEKTLPALAA
jgi:SAM-dependent methyltransferase